MGFRLLVWNLMLVTGVAAQACTIESLNFATEGKNSINPKGLGDITSMRLYIVYRGSHSCKRGISYGFEGENIWTAKNCRAQFRVCGKREDSQRECKVVMMAEAGNKRIYKEMDNVVTSMILVAKHSLEACVFAFTFGVEGKRIWTDRNCRGDFNVCTKKPEEQLKCRSIYMNKNTDFNAFAPKGFKEIKSINVEKAYKHSKPCLLGRSFGIDKNKIWTSNKCRAVFNVCGTSDAEADRKEYEERLHKMFGKEGQSTEEIEKGLHEINKRLNKDSCRCTTWGDPHFLGFDGGSINFNGICEYTLVRSTDRDLGDCAFDVTVENERRYGKHSTSFVEKVHIRMDGKEITLGTNKLLLVDGERRYDGYKHKDIFQVVSSGADDLIFTSSKCELHVAFRRNNAVEVTTGGRYSGHMEGLCGNCDGNKADDLNLANGKPPTGQKTWTRNIQIGNSWHINRDREGQPEGCDKPETNDKFPENICTREQAQIADEMCEPLRDDNGPFGECFKAARNRLFPVYEGCLYDACSFHDNEEQQDSLRCAAFETMAWECEKLGIAVKYRDQTNCNNNCPTNFVFFDFVPECQSTCSNHHPTGDCRKRTSPGCMCAEGFVLDGQKCVKPNECGCTYHERYVSQGDFMLTDQCTRKRTCQYDEELKKSVFIATTHSCGENAHCNREGGEHLCKCNRLFKREGHTCVEDKEAIEAEKKKEQEERREREDNMCTCMPWGDPHYKRYDGDIINFMGKCTYLISGTKTSEGKCDFAVKAKNQVNDAHSKGSFTRDIYIEYRGLLVEIRAGKKVFVNGEKRLLPYESKKTGVTIDFRGKYVEFLTDPECDIHVAFDGEYSSQIKIPKRMGTEMIGLCGNCDGVKEYETREGENVSEEKDRDMKIGNSWRVPNPTGIKELANQCSQQEPMPECPVERKGEAVTECGRLKHHDGPFGACIARLNTNPNFQSEMNGLYDSCVHDACAFMGTKDWAGLRCNYNEEMSGLCTKRGVTVHWRNKDFCPNQDFCPANSVYKARMSGCQPSCLGPRRATECLRDEVEGCECKEGFVQDQDKCVQLGECGCRNQDGDYVSVGSRFLSGDCSRIFECVLGRDGSELVSVRMPHGACHARATCKVGRDRRATCVCDQGFTGNGYHCEPKAPEPEPPKEGKPLPNKPENACVCTANGDPRVVQFDKGRLWVNNPCKFILAQSNSRECPFRVEMKAVSHTKHPHMSYVYEIDVKTPERHVRIGQTLEVNIKERPGAPFVKTEVRETRQIAEHVWLSVTAEGISVHTDCGLVVLFDGKGEVTTTVDAKLARTVTGLCGNCDGDQSNDRKDKDGRRPSHYPDRNEGHNAVTNTFIIPDDSSDPDLSTVCSRK